MTAGKNGADVRLFEQVAFHPPDDEAFFADDREIAGAHAEQTDVGAADRSRQLDPGVERHLLPAEQADLPAEKRIDVGARRRNATRGLGPGAGEVEDARPLQEEGSFL